MRGIAGDCMSHTSKLTVHNVSILKQSIFAGSLESAYWLRRWDLDILGQDGNEPLVVL